MQPQSKTESFDSAGKFVMKNPDCVLVHGLVSGLDLIEMPYAWVRKGGKVYDVEHDKWYASEEWNARTVEKNSYVYEEVLRLVDSTSHLGPWTREEFESAKSQK